MCANITTLPPHDFLLRRKFFIINVNSKAIVVIKNNGRIEKKYCEIGEQITVVADQPPQGKKFAYWTVNGALFYYSETCTFGVFGNIELETVYIDSNEEVVQEPGAMLSNVLFKETTTGKYRVSFVCQLSVPEGYELEEAGIFWSKTSLASLHNADGNAVSGARKVNAKSTNRQYQYTININNVPSEFTLYQEVFAKVKNTKTGEYSWVYTTVKPVTVP